MVAYRRRVLWPRVTKEWAERYGASSGIAPYPYVEAKARYVFGQLHAAMGAHALAREEYEWSLALCDRLGERPYRARIEAAFTALAGESGK